MSYTCLAVNYGVATPYVCLLRHTCGCGHHFTFIWHSSFPEEVAEMGEILPYNFVTISMFSYLIL